MPSREDRSKPCCQTAGMACSRQVSVEGHRANVMQALTATLMSEAGGEGTQWASRQGLWFRNPAVETGFLQWDQGECGF